MQLQVVQEELQQLSHRLDTPKMGVVLSAGSDAGEENLHSSDDESLGGGVSMSSRSPADQAQLRTRLKTLKTEFSELIGELRRRSSIVEGVPMSFEVRLVYTLSQPYLFFFFLANTKERKY